MEDAQCSRVQQAIQQKLQEGRVTQAVGLLKYLHQKCSDAQLSHSTFTVFIVTLTLRAHLSCHVEVLEFLVSKGYDLDYPVTINASGSSTERTQMASAEVLAYSHPHLLQQKKFQAALKFSVTASKLRHYPSVVRWNLIYTLQEISDANSHFNYFSTLFSQSPKHDPLPVLPEFDLTASKDPRTLDFILNYTTQKSGVEPNYFAQFIAIREKWWVRVRSTHQKLSDWNEKIAMKQKFASTPLVQDKMVVPTLYSAYFDQFKAATEETTLTQLVTEAVTEAVVLAFNKDPSLQKVYIKPTHMCRGLGITVTTRDDVEKVPFSRCLQGLSSSPDQLFDNCCAMSVELFHRQFIFTTSESRSVSLHALQRACATSSKQCQAGGHCRTTRTSLP